MVAPDENDDYLDILCGEDIDEEIAASKGKFSLKTLLQDIHAHSVLIFVFASPWIFLALCFNPAFWPIAILYFCWMYYDRETPHRGGRRFPYAGKLQCWKMLKRYFPMQLVKTAELPPDRNYLFATFPHGILCYGSGCNLITTANRFDEAYPGLKPTIVSIDGGFNIPIARDMALLIGMCASSASSIKYILNGPPGNVCIVIVGGVAEMIMSYPGTNKLFIRNRKGFVKLALQSGASLVPVFTFGETNTYEQCSWKIYQFLQRKIRETTRAPLLLVRGRGFLQDFFGFLPRKTPLTTVIGKPIDLPKVENPTDDVINQYHQKFITEMEKLFNRFKGKYDIKGEEAVLEIV